MERVLIRTQQKIETLLSHPIKRDKVVLVGSIGLQVLWLGIECVTLVGTAIWLLSAGGEIRWVLLCSGASLFAAVMIVVQIYSRPTKTGNILLILGSFGLWAVLVYAGVWRGGMIITSIVFGLLIYELVENKKLLALGAMYVATHTLLSVLPRMELPVRPADFFWGFWVAEISFLLVAIFITIKAQFEISQSIQKTTAILELRDKFKEEEKLIKQVSKEIEERNRELEEVNLRLVEKKINGGSTPSRGAKTGGST